MNNLEKVELLKAIILQIDMFWYMTKVSVVEAYRRIRIGSVTSQRKAKFMWMFFPQIHVQHNNDFWRNCPPVRIVSVLVDNIQSGTWLPTIQCNVLPIIFSALVITHVPDYNTASWPKRRWNKSPLPSESWLSVAPVTKKALHFRQSGTMDTEMMPVHQTMPPISLPV